MSDKLFAIVIVTKEEPSHLDIVSRGGFDPRPIRGSITTRHKEMEEYPVEATSRDAAIALFRDKTGYRGAIEQVKQIDGERNQKDFLEDFEDSKRHMKFGRNFD